MVNSSQGGSIRQAVVIGCGEVFQRCYVVGASHLPPERSLRFALLVDVVPEEELRRYLPYELLEYDFAVRQLLPPYEESLAGLVRGTRWSGLPMLIAAPTRYHVPYSRVLLDENHFVAVEKPVAACPHHVQQFQGLISRHGTNRMFLFAYYLLEKGLPLMIWARYGQVDPFVGSLVILHGPCRDWQQIRVALGEVLDIYGVILEGRGTAGGLLKRQWVLEPSNGGNTVETFYHLVCLTMAVVGLECPSVVCDVHLARHASLAHELGHGAAETLTWATMKTATGAKIELIAAKYVPPGLHQRWVVVKCERGLVKMDLEAQRLEVRTDDVCVSSSLRYPHRYTTQFMLLTEKLNRPELPIEDRLLLQALAKTLEIRQIGLESGIGSYVEEDIEPRYISSEMSRYLVPAGH